MPSFVDQFADAISRHPFLALGASNGLMAAYAIYVVSEGQPLALIKKTLFRAVMSVAPKSLVDAEMDKIRSKIEDSVVGHAMDGMVKYSEIPEDGEHAGGHSFMRS